MPVVLILSCGSGPKPAEQTPVEQAPVVPAAPAPAVQPVTPAPAVQPVQEAPPPAPPPAPQVVQTVPPPEKAFDPGTITEEKYETTKADVRSLIEELNKIIRARNYNAWVGYLSDSYFKEISSKAFLDERTEELYKRDQIADSKMGKDPRRTQKKILRTPKDYFDNVVVPSRYSDRLDDIAFMSENQVKAYTVDSKGQRLVLYDLELINNKWKIIN